MYCSCCDIKMAICFTYVYFTCVIIKSSFKNCFVYFLVHFKFGMYLWTPVQMQDQWWLDLLVYQ
jgi:hypothetical protein